MYACESWTVKKAEHQRIDALELWCWRRLLRVPWTARRSNQSILKEISPEYSLERLMLKLQYFGHLMRRTDSLENTLILGKIEGRRRGRQRMRWMDGITYSTNVSLVKFQKRWRTGKPGELQSIVLQRVKHDWATEQEVSNAAELACLPPHSQVRADLLGDFQVKKKTCTVSERLLICSPFSDPCQHCRLVWLSFLLPG